MTYLSLRLYYLWHRYNNYDLWFKCKIGAQFRGELVTIPLIWIPCLWVLRSAILAATVLDHSLDDVTHNKKPK